MGDGQRAFLRFRIALRAICWFCLAVCWAYAGTVLIVGLRQLSAPSSIPQLPLPPAGQVCQNVEWMYRPTDKPHATAWHVALGRLKVANGQLGLFTTPIHKTLMIEQLHIRQYRDDTAEAVAPSETGATGGLEALDELAGPALQQIRRWLRCCDCATPTKLFIKDFCFEKNSRQQPALTVSCLLLQANYNSRKLELHGDVRVDGHNGRVLKSSCVVWDPRLKRFHVPGRYLLVEPRQTVSGRGTWFGERLETLTPEHAGL